MIRAAGLFHHRQRTLGERLGLCVLPLGNVRRCELIQVRGHCERAGLFPNRQEALVEWLGLLVLPLGDVHRPSGSWR